MPLVRNFVHLTAGVVFVAGALAPAPVAARTAFDGQWSVLIVTNNGPNGVTGATFTNTISGGAGGVTWTCNSSGSANCPPLSDPHTGNINSQVDLPMGGQLILNVTVTSGTNLTDHASINSSVSDPVSSNNSRDDGPVSVL